MGEAEIAFVCVLLKSDSAIKVTLNTERKRWLQFDVVTFDKSRLSGFSKNHAILTLFKRVAIHFRETVNCFRNFCGNLIFFRIPGRDLSHSYNCLGRSIKIDVVKFKRNHFS